jgi:hypothetical protein
MARKEVPTPHEAYMMGHRHGSAGKPAKPPDPQKVRGDGMKTAMRGEGRRSEVSPMRAAREMVR